MTPTVSLALATLAFVGSHLAMSHPLRPTLVARLGERAFLGIYSLISFVTLGWMIFAWRATIPEAPLWLAPAWWWPLASGLMLLASVLLVGSLIGNPAFPNPGAGPRDIPPPRGVFAITRHPMNTSFVLWALVHISLSGSSRNLIVAGGILLLALLGTLGQDRKKEHQLGDVWRDWQRRTSILPFAALANGTLRWRNAFPGGVALIGGTLLWALVTSWHAPMASPLGGLLSR